MAQTIRSAKQKLINGSYSEPIPFGAYGVNITLANGFNLEETLGTVALEAQGTVQAQIDTNRKNIASNDVDIANLQNRVTVNESDIATHSVQISDRYTKAEIDTLLADRLRFEAVETW